MTEPHIHLAWQDPDTRRWYPVGRFGFHDGSFTFEYLSAQAARAQAEANFSGVPQFPDFSKTYTSNQLFPFLANRLIRPDRYDFKQQQLRLDMASVTDYDNPRDIFEILARTGGRRQTDNFEFFRPLTPQDGQIRCIFFSRGISYIDPEIRDFWASGSTPKGTLRLVADMENPADEDALIIIDEAIRPMGFVPRYYSRDLSRLYHAGAIQTVSVARHNPHPAPDQERFLIRLVADAID